MSWSRNVDHLTYTYDPIQDGSITQGPNCHKCMNRLFHDKKLINVALFRIYTSVGIVSFTPSSLVFSNGSDSPFSMKNIPEDIVVLKCVSCARMPLRRKYPETDADINDVTSSSIAPKRARQDYHTSPSDDGPTAVLSYNCGLQVSESEGERRICESMEQGIDECHVPFVRISAAEEGLRSEGVLTSVPGISDKDATVATHINATNEEVPVAEETLENSISKASHIENAEEHKDVSSTPTEKKSLTETKDLPNNSHLAANSTSHSSIEIEGQSFASKLTCSSSIQPSNPNLGKDTGCKPPLVDIPDSSIAATVICNQLSLNVSSPNNGQKVSAEENHDAAPEVVTENRTEVKQETAEVSSTDNSALVEQALGICNTTFTFPFMYGRRPSDKDLVPESDALRMILPFNNPDILQKLAFNYFAAPQKFFCRYCDHHFVYSSGPVLVQHVLSIPHLAAVYENGYAFSYSEDVAKLTAICKKLQIKVPDTNLPGMVLKDTQTLRECDVPSVSTANTPIVSLEERSSVIQLSYGNKNIPDCDHSANFIEQDKVNKHPTEDSLASCESSSNSDHSCKQEELSTPRNSTECDMSPMSKPPGYCDPPASSFLESIEASMGFSGQLPLNNSEPTPVSLSNLKHSEEETTSVGHVPYMLNPDSPQLSSLHTPFVQPNVSCSTIVGNQGIGLPFMFGRSLHEVDDPMSIDDKTHTITHFKKFAKNDILSALSEHHYFGEQKTIDCIICHKTFHSEYASSLIRHFTTMEHWNNVLQSNRVFSFSKDYQKLFEMYNEKCTGKQKPIKPPRIPFVNKDILKRGAIAFEKLFNCLAWLRGSELLDEGFSKYMMCIFPHLKKLFKCYLCKHKVVCQRNSNDYLSHFLSTEHIVKAVENGWNLGPEYERLIGLVLSYLRGNDRIAEAADVTKQMQCAVEKKQFSSKCADYKHLFNEIP